MRRRLPVLTPEEIDAVLAVAWNADARETFEDEDDEKEMRRQYSAYERGVEKLVTLSSLLSERREQRRSG